MTECGREPEVIAAVYQAAWSSRPGSPGATAGEDASESPLPEDLRAHVETCPACAEALTVARALRASAALDEDDALPPSRWLVVKAQVRQRQLKAHRLERLHAWSILGGAWALLLVAVCLILPALAGADASRLQATGLIGLLTFLLTAATFVWRWSHLER